MNYILDTLLRTRRGQQNTHTFLTNGLKSPHFNRALEKEPQDYGHKRKEWKQDEDSVVVRNAQHDHRGYGNE